MFVKALTPILNVSDIQASFTWCKKLGWEKNFEWGDPVGFGGVCSGEVEISLCEGAQGGQQGHKHVNALVFWARCKPR